MKVYRIGHASFTRVVDNTYIPSGPYNGVPWDELTEDWPEMIFSHSGIGSEDHHPAPHLDPSLAGINQREVCGFDSLAALLNWFSGWHWLLNLNDFRVWEYEVDDSAVRVGAFGQAVFFPSAARCLADYEVPEGDVQLSLF